MRIESVSRIEGIDSHQHFVDLDRFEYYWMRSLPESFRRGFGPEQVLPEMSRLGIRNSIVVQAHPTEEETWTLVELASRYSFIRGIVAWIDLTDPHVEAALSRYLREPLIRGVRQQQAEDAEADWFAREDVIRGLKAVERSGLVYDALCRPHQLHALATAAEACPKLRIILEHAGKPAVRLHEIDGWAGDLERLGAKPNVCCKLSELLTQADWQGWKARDLVPYVEHCFSAFGFDRLMWGSGWPVCLLASSYQQTLSTVLDALPAATENETAHLLRNTAIDWYGIDPQ